MQARQLERDATLFQQFLQGTRAAVVLTVQQEYLAACCVTRPGQQRRLIGMCREAVDRPRLRAHRDMFVEDAQSGAAVGLDLFATLKQAAIEQYPAVATL